MGLFDGVLGNLMGGNSGNNPFLQIAMQMLANKGGGGAGGGGTLDSMGGLSGIINAFQQAGLGHLADSWVGTGANLPVSADQLTQALGSGKIAEIASQLGISHGDAAGGLAQILPELINHITPNGQLPASHSVVEDALSMFLKR